MKINDYNKPIPKYFNKATYYRALEDGAGFSKGDIICRVQQMDEATLQPTGVENWSNVDTGLALAAAPVVGVDVEALDSKRVLLTSETLTTGNAAAGLAAIPANANHAEIQVLDNDVVFTVDGATTPVSNPAPLGVMQADCQIFELESADEIANFNVQNLDAGANARLYVQYYCQFDLNE